MTSSNNRKRNIRPTAAEIRQAWLTIKEKAAAGDVAACIGLIQLSQDQPPVSELAEAAEAWRESQDAWQQSQKELFNVAQEIIEALAAKGGDV